MNKEKCFGCGAYFEPQPEYENRYGVATTGCWAKLTQLLAHEIQVFGYPPVHRLMVDAYGVQHPQNEMQQSHLKISPRLIKASIQSVHLHLFALCLAIEEKINLLEISKLMSKLLNKKDYFEPLTPPESFGKITVADMKLTFDSTEYDDKAWSWAQNAWQAWEKDGITWFIL